MESKFDPRLEHLVHEELKKLAPVAAPPELVPAVLRRIAARAALPWWRKSWWHWPWLAKTAFLALASCLAAGVIGGAMYLDMQVPDYTVSVQDWPQWRLAWDWLNTAWAGAWGYWQAHLQPLALYGAAALAFLYVAVLGTGTLLVRTALKRS